MKTAVIIDSGSNIYNEDIQIEGLFAVPLQIIDGDDTYLESVEISTSAVNQLMVEGKMLKTSLPSIGMIEDLFQTLKRDGYERVFAVPITSGISGTLNAMRTAAGFVDIEFDYIDCFTTARAQLEIAMAARTMLDKDMAVDTIKERLNDSINHSNTYIVPDDLNHLSRGGRLSPMAAKLGGLLKIKPILYLNKATEGIIEPFGKVRTMSKAIDKVVENMIAAGVGANYVITIADVLADSILEGTIKKFKDAFPNAELYVTPLISTVGVHVGVGSIALQYIKKPITE